MRLDPYVLSHAPGAESPNRAGICGATIDVLSLAMVHLWFTPGRRIATLFMGPPGVGKSPSAKAAADAAAHFLTRLVLGSVSHVALRNADRLGLSDSVKLAAAVRRYVLYKAAESVSVVREPPDLPIYSDSRVYSPLITEPLGNAVPALSFVRMFGEELRDWVVKSVEEVSVPGGRVGERILEIVSPVEELVNRRDDVFGWPMYCHAFAVSERLDLLDKLRISIIVDPHISGVERSVDEDTLLVSLDVLVSRYPGILESLRRQFRTVDALVGGVRVGLPAILVKDRDNPLTKLADLLGEGSRCLSTGYGCPGGVPGKDVVNVCLVHFLDVRIGTATIDDVRGVPSDVVARVIAESVGGTPEERLREVVRQSRAALIKPAWVPTKGIGVLFLDEINLAPYDIQGAAYQILHERRVGVVAKISNGYMIAAAANPPEYAPQVAKEIPDPLLDRFLPFHVIPTPDGFRAWLESAARASRDSVEFLMRGAGDASAENLAREWYLSVRGVRSIATMPITLRRVDYFLHLFPQLVAYGWLGLSMQLEAVAEIGAEALVDAIMIMAVKLCGLYGSKAPMVLREMLKRIDILGVAAVLGAADSAIHKRDALCGSAETLGEFFAEELAKVFKSVYSAAEILRNELPDVAEALTPLPLADAVKQAVARLREFDPSNHVAMDVERSIYARAAAAARTEAAVRRFAELLGIEQGLAREYMDAASGLLERAARGAIRDPCAGD